MKNELSRRGFIAAAGVGAAGAAHASLLSGAAPEPVPPRKFYFILSLAESGFTGPSSNPWSWPHDTASKASTRTRNTSRDFPAINSRNCSTI